MTMVNSGLKGLMDEKQFTDVFYNRLEQFSK